MRQVTQHYEERFELRDDVIDWALVGLGGEEPTGAPDHTFDAGDGLLDPVAIGSITDDEANRSESSACTGVGGRSSQNRCLHSVAPKTARDMTPEETAAHNEGGGRCSGDVHETPSETELDAETLSRPGPDPRPANR
jgi:hypothetical protein